MELSQELRQELCANAEGMVGTPPLLFNRSWRIIRLGGLAVGFIISTMIMMGYF